MSSKRTRSHESTLLLYCLESFVVTKQHKIVGRIRDRLETDSRGGGGRDSLSFEHQTMTFVRDSAKRQLGGGLNDYGGIRHTTRRLSCRRSEISGRGSFPSCNSSPPIPAFP